MNALTLPERPPVLDTVVKTLAAHVVAIERKTDVNTACKDIYPGQPQVILASLDLSGWLRKQQVNKATTSPAATTVAGWAAELVGRGAAGMLAALSAPISAYAELSARGVSVSFAGVGTVAVTGRAPKSIAGFFVGEGQPLPVVSLNLSGATATPYKGGSISFFTGALGKYSTPDIEDVIRQQLALDAAISIDSQLLSGNAGVAGVSPPGLFNGVTPTTPAAGGSPSENFAADLGALAARISMPIDLLYVCSTADWPRLISYSPSMASSLISSPTMDPKSLAAIDAAHFFSVEDPAAFQIAVSREATLVARDDPTPVTSAAGTRGTPTHSAFQADLTCVRLIADVAYGMSVSGRVQWLTGGNW